MTVISGLQTPCFFLDQEILSGDIKSLKQAIRKHWNNTQIAYSVKTNSFPPLLQILQNQDIDVEVVSKDEYELVRKCGYSYDQIVCNGPVKSKEWIDEILTNQITLNLDSKRELNFVRQYALQNPDQKISVGLRVNFDVEAEFPGESNGDNNGIRFGFSYETGELKDAVLFLQSEPNIVISGLHLHVSTKSRSLDIYKYLTRLFAQIVLAYNLKDIQYFDIGGGFFGGIQSSLNWDTYLNSISGILQEYGFSNDSLKLIIEPGVSLIAGAFSYYTKVVDVKKTNRANFVVLDGSRIHIDPFFHKAKYFYTLDSNAKELNGGIPQVLAGFTCLEYDRFFEIETDKPLKTGDLFVFGKVGAYTMTLSPLFISFFPIVYTVNEKGEIVVLREKWEAQEFIQKTKLEIR
ncbi:MAG: hypothetical protein ACRCX4_10725 [Bacteroidales bacterium]